MKLAALSAAFFKRGLKFTPLEFETLNLAGKMHPYDTLKFTPLEFETCDLCDLDETQARLKFTPLEFETSKKIGNLSEQIS